MLAVNAVLFLFLIAHAQSPGGWVAGRVRDAKDSRPLEGVRVSVSRPDGREYVGTSTDSSGSYRILAVPPGGYQISFAAVGYRTLTVAGVAVQSERASFVDLAMEESGADGNGHAEVRWKGRPVNEWGTAYGTVFDRPRLDNLPSPRNIWALLENQEPSSVANRVDEGGMATGTIGLVGVHGGSSWTQNDYRLDGIDVTDPHDTGKPLLYPTFGGLQEFQVSTADHPSERPVPGASSNLTTREGTSEFHFQGEAYYLGRPFQSSNLTKGLRDFGFTTTPHFKEFGEGEFDLGGPIPAGRDWSFFASFGLQHLSTVLPGFSDVPTRSVSSGLLRVDGVLGPQDRLSFMATGQVVRNSNLGAGGGVAPSATLRGNDRFEVGQVHWIHRIDSESVWELGFGY
ncbi:MAG TPA: carboxypeptidase-like regulatory domain-containing protein, partial [Blastocatellia bacterium]|nr:carboxypeptidase-like regulatory domain-containing protein [Blastocatellia bacterium]